jgi:hypothetical protein
LTARSLESKRFFDAAAWFGCFLGVLGDFLLGLSGLWKNVYKHASTGVH